MVLSWVKVNLKKKTENGHCHNPTHRTTQTNKTANCPIESDFHGKLYSDYISMLEDFVESLKAGSRLYSIIKSTINITSLKCSGSP